MTECVSLSVPADCCRIVFAEKSGVGGGCVADYKTARGEDMFVHVDSAGRVVEIELLGGGEARKPCQEVSHE